MDEVGRGPLAGPVIAAAVILNPKNSIVGLCDSKKLTAKRRTVLCLEIKQKAIAWAVGRATVAEIDTLNIHHASLLAMQRAVNALAITPDQAQFDGKFCPAVECMTEAIIKGDKKISAISAASIIAKVTRDGEMLNWHQTYPQYGFDRHSGYATKQHLAALQARDRSWQRRAKAFCIGVDERKRKVSSLIIMFRRVVAPDRTAERHRAPLEAAAISSAGH